jgi:hypothetical protein
MSSNCNSTIHTTELSRSSTSAQPNPSFVIIQTIKDEISNLQTILLQRLIQLEQSCEAATPQQITSQHIIDHQIIPYFTSLFTILELNQHLFLYLFNNKPNYLSFERFSRIIITHIHPSTLRYPLHLYVHYSVERGHSQIFAHHGQPSATNHT